MFENIYNLEENKPNEEGLKEKQNNNIAESNENDEAIKQEKNEIQEKENTQELLKEQLQQAQQTLNINKIKQLTEQLNKDTSKKTEQDFQHKSKPKKDKSEEPPKTLKQARQKIEYQILKGYLNTLSKEQASNYLNSQVNLNEEIKQNLQTQFATKE